MSRKDLGHSDAAASATEGRGHPDRVTVVANSVMEMLSE